MPSSSSNKVQNQNNNDKNANENNIIDNIDNNINNVVGDINNYSEMSNLTVYFPDKVKMKNIMETKWGENIPKLDFGYVPEYSSESESLKNNNVYNNTLIEEGNLYFPKFKKFQNSVLF